MQTNFTEEQLKLKDNKSSEKIFKKCVHCGMCNATCPTFNLLGDELDGPRGRIYLIQDMLENEKKPTANVVKHIDRCLSCYGCMTTCPAEVNYMHLIDHGRKYIEKNYERPFFDRLIRNFLSTVLPNKKLFKLSSLLVRIGKPFKFLMPSKVKDMMDLMPTFFPKKTLKEKEIYTSRSKKKIARVVLLTGCVQKEISPQINEATIRILNRHGVEVVVPKKIRCCGSLAHHLGKNEEAHQDFINNINTWYDEYLKGNLDAILSNTSGCGTTMKDYGFIFRDDKKMKKKAKKISELTKDVSEYLSESLNLKFKNKEKKLRIAYHSACSMQHGQKVHNQPINLLTKTKNEILEIPEGHICCGSAGTFYKTMADNTGSMSFTITSGEYSNKTFVSFMNSGEEGLDNADAYKLLPMSPSERIVGISYAEGNGLDISNLPYNHDGSISIPLDVMYLTVDDDYNFVTEENDVAMSWDLSSLPGHVSLTLTDNVTGTAVNLTEESEITFSTEAKGSFPAYGSGGVNIYPQVGESRFTLTVAYSALTSNDEPANVPGSFALHPAYPNPFNPSTTISFDIPDAVDRNTSLHVYDITGKLVETLVNGIVPVGTHTITWDPKNLSAGLYIVQLKVGNKTFNQKLTFLK